MYQNSDRLEQLKQRINRGTFHGRGPTLFDTKQQANIPVAIKAAMINVQIIFNPLSLTSQSTIVIIISSNTQRKLKRMHNTERDCSFPQPGSFSSILSL